MALKNLIVNQSEITDSLVENILTGRVILTNQNFGVALTKETLRVSPRLKILLFLAGKHAWKIINELEEPLLSSIDEISNATGIFGSTMRVKLMELRKDHYIESEKGKYFIQPHGMLAMEDIIKKESEHLDKKSSLINTTKVSHGKKKKTGLRPSILQSLQEKPFSGEVITNIVKVLRKMKHVDSYLLIIFVANKYLGITGLTPGEINYFLSEPPINLPNKYYTTNISRDLGKARDYVNPNKVGLAYEYRLNRNGEEYINSLITNVGGVNL